MSFCKAMACHLECSKSTADLKVSLASMTSLSCKVLRISSVWRSSSSIPAQTSSRTGPSSNLAQGGQPPCQEQPSSGIEHASPTGEYRWRSRIERTAHGSIHPNRWRSAALTIASRTMPTTRTSIWSPICGSRRRFGGRSCALQDPTRYTQRNPVRRRPRHSCRVDCQRTDLERRRHAYPNSPWADPPATRSKRRQSRLDLG